MIIVLLDNYVYKIILMLVKSVNKMKKLYFEFEYDQDLNDQLIQINFGIYLNINKLKLNLMHHITIIQCH